MNYGEVKTYLRSLINRKDISEDLAAQFIQQSQTRLERVLRPAFMQRLVSFSIDDGTGVFSLPDDFLELIDIYTENGGQVERVDISQYLKYASDGVGLPYVFVQTGSSIRLRPLPSEDEVLYMLYYRALDPLDSDDDENTWTTAATDALIFGAAILAAHHYEDERLGNFTEQYAIFLSELQDQVINENFSGPMRVQSAYSFQDDCD